MSSGNVAADQLRLSVERIERLELEKQALADDLKDVYAELKSNGYCTKTVRKVVALRKLEADARQEADAMLATYREALGMANGFTPLENAIRDLDRLSDEGGLKTTLKFPDGAEIQFGKGAAVFAGTAA